MWCKDATVKKINRKATLSNPKLLIYKTLKQHIIATCSGQESLEKIKQVLNLQNPKLVFRIRIGFIEDPAPNPAFYLNADPDPGSQTNADPGPGQTLPSQKFGF
jgi:hypothetical protein